MGIADGQVKHSGARGEVVDGLLTPGAGCKYYNGQEA